MSPYWVVPLTVAGIGLFSSWSPLWTRRNLFFGVTTEPGFRETTPARDILRSYRLRLWLTVAVVLVLSLLLYALTGHVAQQYGALLVLIAGSLWSFARANRAARPFAVSGSTVRSAAIGVGPSPFESWPVMLAGPVILATTVLIASWLTGPTLSAGWDSIHQGKHLGFVMGMAIGSWGVGPLLRYGSRRSPVIPGQRRLVLQNSVIINLILCLISAGAIAAAAAGYAIPDLVPIAAVSLACVLLAFHLVRLSRLGLQSGRVQVTPAGDGTPDERWKWGFFYCNPDDPAILIEKRSGPGYTLNFGRPAAWAITAGFLVLLMLPLISRHL